MYVPVLGGVPDDAHVFVCQKATQPVQTPWDIHDLIGHTFSANAILQTGDVPKSVKFHEILGSQTPAPARAFSRQESKLG